MEYIKSGQQKQLLFFTDFWACNIVKRDIFYDNSVFLTIRLSHHVSCLNSSRYHNSFCILWWSDVSSFMAPNIADMNLQILGVHLNHCVHERGTPIAAKIWPILHYIFETVRDRM